MRPVFCLSWLFSQFGYDSSITDASLQFNQWNNARCAPLTPWFLLLITESAKHTEIVWAMVVFDSFFFRNWLIFRMSLSLISYSEIVDGFCSFLDPLLRLYFLGLLYYKSTLGILFKLYLTNKASTILWFLCGCRGFLIILWTFLSLGGLVVLPAIVLTTFDSFYSSI